MNLANRQTGAVLIVSLLMLMVMTLIGVTAMQSNLLQEKMAGNFKDMNTAFQAAEAALRDGEKDIVSSGRISWEIGNIFDSDCKNGLCKTANINIKVWKDSATKSNYIPFGLYTGANPPKKLGCIPKYWIEVLPNNDSCINCRNNPHKYRITTVACGANANTKAILQSVFMP